MRRRGLLRRFILCLLVISVLLCLFIWLVQDEFMISEYQGKNERRSKRIVILGAGPTGLGAAIRIFELKGDDTDINVIVVEQGAGPGGLASSERDENGFLWDMGGHVVFSHYKYFDLTLDRAIQDWNNHKRAAFAFMMDSDYKRRFIPYPVQSNIDSMDKGNRDLCLRGLEEIIANPRNVKPVNFDDWLLQNFGEGLCEVFMRKYNKKVWTVNTTEMNAVWVGERVAIPDIERLKHKIKALGKLKKPTETSWGPNKYFRFPCYNGTGNIWKKVSQLVPDEWFRYDTKVTSIDTEKKELKLLVNKKRKESIMFDYLITTAPLDELVKMIIYSDSTLSHNKQIVTGLIYSHTHIVGIGMSGSPPRTLADKSWMYFPDSDSPFYRVTVFSSYSDNHVPLPGKQWSLMCESAQPMNKTNVTKWNKNNMIDETIKALVNYGFITENSVISRYYRRLDHGYPVPSLSRESILMKVQPWLETKNIYSRGRFGGWRYEVANQDHSFMQGVEIIDSLLMNIDEETYPRPSFVNNRGKSQSRLLKTVPDIEIVVAHYNEDLGWLKRLSNISHIYHKGNQSKAQFKVYKWEKLPNVGRESHTYHYHIINNYDYLADITVFLHGHGVSDPLYYANKAKVGWFCGQEYRNTRFGRISYVGKWLKEFLSGKIKPSVFNIGEFYEILFNRLHPESYKLCLQGMFSVRRGNLLKHRKEFYLKAISYVDKHVNPEEGHYFERFWRTIISHEY